MAFKRLKKAATFVGDVLAGGTQTPEIYKGNQKASLPNRATNRPAVNASRSTPNVLDVFSSTPSPAKAPSKGPAPRAKGAGRFHPESGLDELGNTKEYYQKEKESHKKHLDWVKKNPKQAEEAGLIENKSNEWATEGIVDWSKL